MIGKGCSGASTRRGDGKGSKGLSRPFFYDGAKPLLDRIDRLHKEWGLFSRGDSLVVGLSGGPDSAALLFLLRLLSRRFGLKLVAAHLQHGIDRERSVSHARVARRLAASAGVPFVTERADVPGYARRNKLSLEEAGRDLRYRFFERVALRRGLRKICTAHTLDDQAETVMLRILRGSGLQGLCGIPAVRRHGTRTLIRPLLHCRKKELLAFLKANSIPYALDRSNADIDLTRNRVRHRLLPLMRRFNPSVDEALSSLRDAAAEAEELLSERAERASATRLAGGPGSVTVERGAGGLGRALRRKLLRLAVRRCQGSDRRVSSVHIEALDKLLTKGGQGGIVVLPAGLRAVLKGRFLCLEAPV